MVGRCGKKIVTVEPGGHRVSCRPLGNGRVSRNDGQRMITGEDSFKQRSPRSGTRAYGQVNRVTLLSSTHWFQ